MMQNALRQKENELKQANSELEERGKLLYKTKVRHQRARAQHRHMQSVSALCSRCHHAHGTLRRTFLQWHKKQGSVIWPLCYGSISIYDMAFCAVCNAGCH